MFVYVIFFIEVIKKSYLLPYFVYFFKFVLSLSALNSFAQLVFGVLHNSMFGDDARAASKACSVGICDAIECLHEEMSAILKFCFPWGWGTSYGQQYS